MGASLRETRLGEENEGDSKADAMKCEDVIKMTCHIEYQGNVLYIY